MHLKQSGKILHPYLKRILFIVVVVFLSSCSSNVIRLTDGISSGQTSVQLVNMQTEQVSPPNVHDVIESFELPPLPLQHPNHKPIDQIALPGIGTKPRVLGTLPTSINTEKSTLKMEKGIDQRKIHIVQIGDTLYRIARNNNITIEKLKRENGLSTDVICVGQVVLLPKEVNKSKKTVALLENTVDKPAIMLTKETGRSPSLQEKNRENGDTKIGTEMKTETPVAQLGQAVVSTVDSSSVSVAQKLEEKEMAITPSTEPSVSISSVQMHWPARGRILSHYGQRDGININDGMDIMVPEGTSVRAADGGIVIYADDGLKELGNTVLIRHGDNIVTVYGHNSKILVQRGQEVHRGDEIAKSGMSGNALTPRLHFEVRENSLPVDPVKYLEN